MTPLFLVWHISNLSASPIGSTFKIYSGSNHVPSLLRPPRSKPLSSPIYVTERSTYLYPCPCPASTCSLFPTATRVIIWKSHQVTLLFNLPLFRGFYHRSCENLQGAAGSGQPSNPQTMVQNCSPTMSPPSLALHHLLSWTTWNCPFAHAICSRPGRLFSLKILSSPMAGGPSPPSLLKCYLISKTSPTTSYLK